MTLPPMARRAAPPRARPAPRRGRGVLGGRRAAARGRCVGRGPPAVLRGAARRWAQRSAAVMVEASAQLSNLAVGAKRAANEKMPMIVERTNNGVTTTLTNIGYYCASGTRVQR